MEDRRRRSAALINRHRLLLLAFISVAYISAAAASARPGFILHPNQRRLHSPVESIYYNVGSGAAGGSCVWPRMVPRTATVSNVFGSRALERFGSDLTLLVSATARSGDGDGDASSSSPFVRLLHQGTAALLNSYTRRPSFPFSPWQVKTLLIQGLASESAAARGALQFSAANLACD